MGSLPANARVLVVHNPNAGMTQPDLDALLEAMRARGYRVVYRSLAEVSARESLEGEADLVVAAGGDGTVAKLAARLRGTGRPMTVLPLGTANNLGRHLGIEADPFAAVAALGELRARSLDVGVAVGPFGRRLFFESAGLGLLARTMSALTEAAHQQGFESAEAKITALRAHLARVLEGTSAEPYQLTIDGRPVDAALLVMEASNIGAAGPRIALAPHADSTDGRLDVILAGEDHRAWLARAVESGEPAERPPATTITRAREVRFEWRGDPLHVDDTVYARTPRAHEKRPRGPVPGEVHLRVEAGALRVLAPLPSPPRAQEGAARGARTIDPS